MIRDGIEDRSEWKTNSVAISGMSFASNNFLMAKDAVPFEDLLSPHANWTLEALFQINDNKTMPFDDTGLIKSELSLMIVGNDTLLVDNFKTEGKDDGTEIAMPVFSVAAGIGFYAVKTSAQENDTVTVKKKCFPSNCVSFLNIAHYIYHS